MTQYEELPLFPLTAHVLPHGKLCLRIFEPRYTRLVKRCMSEQSDFVICMFDPNEGKDSENYILPYGTAVKIIDFEMLDDGFLGITVEGVSRICIKQRHRESDGLHVGSVERLDDWPTSAVTDEKTVLKDRLKEIYQVYPELGSLYKAEAFDELSWLCQRWLEILPLDVHVKQNLIKQDNSLKVSEYLLQLVA
ncbi:MAG: LON peptidase substrate-binding domain-containing protein [Pseudomonadota bacterium]